MPEVLLRPWRWSISHKPPSLESCLLDGNSRSKVPANCRFDRPLVACLFTSQLPTCLRSGWLAILQLERNSGLKWCLASQTKLEAELDRYRSLKKALGKRAEKQSEIRDHTAQQLQLAFNKCESHPDHGSGLTLHRTPASIKGAPAHTCCRLAGCCSGEAGWLGKVFIGCSASMTAVDAISKMSGMQLASRAPSWGESNISHKVSTWL